MVGKEEVERNLTREIRGIAGRTRAGIRLACLLVRRRAQNLTPVDTGALKNSAWTEVVNTSRGPVGAVFYNASYAVHVHENMTARHETGIAKFLETAYNISLPEIKEIIRRTARPKR